MSQVFSTETRKKAPGVQQEVNSYPNPELLSLLGSFAILGQIFLFASAWLLPAVSEYRLIGDNMSELVLGSYGFIQTAAFVIAGLTTLGLAYAIRKFTAGAWGSFIGSFFVGIYGLGAILVALFPTNQVDTPADVFSQTPTGMIHMLSALVSFLCMIIAMFILSRTFGKVVQLRSLLRGSVLFAGSALALFIVQDEGPLVGLLQRLMVLAISGWIIMVSLRLRSIAASPRSLTNT